MAGLAAGFGVQGESEVSSTVVEHFQSLSEYSIFLLSESLLFQVCVCVGVWGGF